MVTLQIITKLKRGQTRRSVEPLSLYYSGWDNREMIRNYDNIQGFKITGIETKISQYADDTLFFLDGSETSFLNVIE